MKKIIVTIFFLFSALGFANDYKKSSNLIEGTLPNGMQYFIYKNEYPKNKAFFQLAVKAGSMQEESGDEGIAHILEHMAFNGTKKYQKNDVIKYLESIGLSFGGDLNAHTSFEETIYKLLIPTDDREKYEKGIEILKEWANEIEISPEELESEKKVVLEEWRLSQGLIERMGEIQKQLLFEGTPYLNKYPIGTKETINSSTKESLDVFYKKWYHPKNMAIIAVGDFNLEETEKLIKQLFNYKPDNEYTAPKEFSLNKTKNKYAVFSDPEITETTLQVIKMIKVDPVVTGEDYRRHIIKKLTENIINSRFNNLIKESETPLLGGVFLKYNFIKGYEMINFVSLIKNDQIDKGINFTCDILRNMSKSDVSEIELNLEKLNILNGMKMYVTNKDTITHQSYGASILDYYMNGTNFVEVNDKYNYLVKNIETITLDEINKELKDTFSDESLYFLTTSSKIKNIPTNKRLEKIIKKAKNNRLALDFTVKEIVLPPIKLEHGTILEKKEGFYKLSNGINVYTKHTDFDKDKIYIKLFKQEGTSSSDYKEYLNSQLASNIILGSGIHNLSPKDLSSYKKGKNFSLSIYIDEYEQGIGLSSDRENLIPALENLSYLIRDPKVDETIFNKTLSGVKQNIKNKNNSPEELFSDEITKTYYNSNKRKMPLTLKEVKSITKKGVLSAFKNKFSNFNGYNLIIVGSFDESNIEDILEKYFASLPKSDVIVGVKPLELNIPKDVISKNVVKGVDKKTQVSIIFPYNHTYGENERELYAAFSKILNIYLTEEIREKLGGVYSIYSYTDLRLNNYGDNRMGIIFSCDTSRLDEINEATLKTLKHILSGNIDEEKIAGIIKNYELSYNENLVKNNFWLYFLNNQIIVGESFKYFTPKEYKELVNKKDLLEFSNKAIKMDNYININLVPEKEEL